MPRKPPRKPTSPRPSKATQYRWTDRTREQIEALRRWYGLPSDAAAVRLAIERTHRAGPPD